MASFFKDAFYRDVILGDQQAIPPAGGGSKAAACYRLAVPAGEPASLRLRLHAGSQAASFTDFARIQQLWQAEADEFFADFLAGATND